MTKPKTLEDLLDDYKWACRDNGAKDAAEDLGHYQGGKRQDEYTIEKLIIDFVKEREDAAFNKGFNTGFDEAREH